MFPVQMYLFNELQNEQRRYQNRIEKRIMRDASDPFQLPDKRFIDLFRLNKNIVHYLFENLMPFMEAEERNSRVSRQTRILIALRFFATGDYQRGVGEEYLLSASQQIVSRCIHEVATCIATNLSPLWIKFPLDERRKNEIKRNFIEKAGFPGIIGCVDCTHVAILAPAHEEHNYVNRKGFHSKNVQIICDGNLEILNINAMYPGSTNDAFIWRGSQIKRVLEEEYNRGGRNNWLLGDSAYPLEPWLLTPFENPNPDSAEFRYNRSHKITRSLIERCNGRLKLVFRCLLGERKLRYNPVKVGTIINACAVLHNISLRAAIQYEIDFQNENIFNMNIINVQNNNQLPGLPVLEEARQVRQQLVNRYFQ